MSEWNNITDNSAILELVWGVHIPLLSPPVQLSTPFPLKLNKEECEALTHQVNAFRIKGIVVPTNHSEGEFISNIFPRPKPNGEVQLILDLTLFNDFVEYKHFKMFSLETARDLITPCLGSLV